MYCWIWNRMACCDRSWSSSVSVVSDYWLDDRGSIPGRGKGFSLTSVSSPVLRPTQPPMQWAPGSFPQGKVRLGREADHWPQRSDEIQNEQELYLLSPLAPAWCERDSFPLCFTAWSGMLVHWESYILSQLSPYCASVTWRDTLRPCKVWCENCASGTLCKMFSRRREWRWQPSGI
jgi:hypothetical protein